jgi:hypothetical protein
MGHARSSFCEVSRRHADLANLGRDGCRAGRPIRRPPFDRADRGSAVRWGTRGTVADDPLARLLPIGNQGGFRVRVMLDAANLNLPRPPVTKWIQSLGICLSCQVMPADLRMPCTSPYRS